MLQTSLETSSVSLSVAVSEVSRPNDWRTVLVHNGDWTQFGALRNDWWIVVGNHGNDETLNGATAIGIGCNQEN